MRYFAIANGIRHDIVGDLTEQAARQVAENKIGLTQYQLMTHEAYWASQAGKQEEFDDIIVRAEAEVAAFARRRMNAIDPDLAKHAEMLSAIWPMLNAQGASPDLARIRAIHNHMKTVIKTRDLLTYDPEQDRAWP